MCLLGLTGTTPPAMPSFLPWPPANLNGRLFCSVLYDYVCSSVFLKIAKTAFRQLQIAAREQRGAFISVRSLLKTTASTFQQLRGNKRPLTGLGVSIGLCCHPIFQLKAGPPHDSDGCGSSCSVEDFGCNSMSLNIKTMWFPNKFFF